MRRSMLKSEKNDVGVAFTDSGHHLHEVINQVGVAAGFPRNGVTLAFSLHARILGEGSTSYHSPTIFLIGDQLVRHNPTLEARINPQWLRK